MTGLELAERYYFEIGRPMLERDFPALLPRIAAGLVGEGSECFGYDDGISRDHDFGPAFCLWLGDDDYAQYGQMLQQAYDSLPKAFLGFPPRKAEPEAGHRVGVLNIRTFYRYFIGNEQPPASPERWNILPEEGIAAAVNGKVFEDNAGEFTAIRNALLAYYPESVRIRRITACASRIARSGQYNYGRCMRRGETVAAELEKAEFIRNVLQLLFLLNRRYGPYAKWAFRAANDLPETWGVLPMLDALIREPVQDAAWKDPEDPYVNRKDGHIVLIELICSRLIGALREQGLTESASDFLQDHLSEIAAHMGV